MAAPKVLVIDDEENILRLIRSGLEEYGYDVSTRANGLEALLFLENVKPQLIIADIMMPRLSGIDLLHALKNRDETRKIPVIFLSAMDEAHMVQKGLDMGAVDYITKPFKVSEIVGKVRHYANSTV
ncbi:MAG: response regulator [Deltaproteobacteria bacterium]|nr:response regulator [Deltaproteobacteria bacterium]